MIYLISCKQTNTCKIGFSKNPYSRIFGIQTGNPYELTLEKIIEGSKNEERKLHILFNKFRLKGEWFVYNNKIKDYFGTRVSINESVQIFKEYLFVSRLLDNSCKVIMTHISFKMEVNSNLIFLVKPTLEEIAKESDISISTIKRSISNLVKKDILIRKGSGLYRVNPKYYWRGGLNNKK